MSAATTIQRAFSALQQPKRRRTPRIPSQRDQEIFKRVAVDCQRQKQVAAELGLSPSSICKIVHRVRRWLAAGRLGDPQTLTALEHQRLERSLAQAREEALYERFLRAYDRQEAHPQQTTIRTETRGVQGSGFRVQDSGRVARAPTRERWSREANHSREPGLPCGRPQPPDELIKTTTTLRDLPPNVQLLKGAQRSAAALQKLAELAPLPEPPQPVPSDEELYRAIFSLLMDWRERAERAGKVVSSECVYNLVDKFLSALLGRDLGSGGGFVSPGPDVREVVRRFVLYTMPLYPPNPAGPSLVEQLGCNEQKERREDDGESGRRGEREIAEGRVGPACAASAGPPAPLSVRGPRVAPAPSHLRSEFRAPSSALAGPPVQSSQFDSSASTRLTSEWATTDIDTTADAAVTSDTPIAAAAAPNSPSRRPVKPKKLNPPPPGSSMLGSVNPPPIDPRIAAAFDPWTRDY